MQWDIKALREKLGECVAKVEAIFETAKAEGRDLTPEESAEVDRIQGTADKPGEIAQIQASMSRVDRFNSISAGAKVGKLSGNLPKNVTDIDGDKPAEKVHATVKRTGTLQSFKGPNADQDAWISGQFLRAVLGQNQQAKQALADKGIKMIHSGDQNDKGGFLVPDVFENALIDLKEQFGVFRQNAMSWPMASSVSLIPRRVSGFTTYFVGEGSTITPSEMSFDQVRLEAKKLAVLTQLSSELDEDSVVSLADVVAREMAYALAVKEDACGFLGDGTATYGGILGLGGAIAAGSTSTATGLTTFATITLAVFEAAAGKLPEFPGINPAWYISKPAYHATMGRLQVAAGGNTVMDIGNGPVREFLGYPVIFTQTLPKTAASAGVLCYFGDLGMTATMGQRRGISIASDSSLGFASDSIYVRCTERFDINVHERGTATEAGPMIKVVFG